MRTPQVYVATLRTSTGQLITVPFVGVDRGQALYAALEIYPDCDLVRLTRDDQWDADG
jgi:hypothetical protein